MILKISFNILFLVPVALYCISVAVPILYKSVPPDARKTGSANRFAISFNSCQSATFNIQIK